MDLFTALARTQAALGNNPNYRGCNIMILNMAHAACPHKFSNVKFFETITWSIMLVRVDYGVWIFEDDEIDHSGYDGGYINWAFSGSYERNGDIIKFKKH